MSAARRSHFVGQFAWIAGGRILAALLQAVLLALAARSMLPADFGLLSAVLGIATFFQTASDLGVSTYLLRERAAEPDSPNLGAALRINARTTVILALLSLVAISVASLVIDPAFWAMLPLAIWASAERNADTRVGIAVADGHAAVSVANLVVRRLVALGLFVGLVWAGAGGTLSFCVSLAAAAAGSSIWANVYARKKVDPSSAPLLPVLREAFAFWANSVATQARNLDSALVATVTTPAVAGFYSTASRLTVPLRILPTSMATAVIPASVKALRSGSSLRPMVKAVVVTVGGMTLIYAVLFALTPWLVPFALGQAYAPAVPAVQVVVAGLPFAAAASLLSALLQGIGEKRYVATVALTTTVACLIAVAVGSVAFGAVGAGAGLGLSFVVQSVLLLVKIVLVRKGTTS